MKNDTQPDATPYKGFSKHCILCGLAALIGATIAVIVIFGVAPRYAYIFEPRCDIASHFIPSAALSSAKVDPAWRLIIRDMVDSAALQAETRLRDHFTLLLAMAGMGTAIILGVFSISQARREEKALSEMKELKIEAKDILAEIRECRETAHTNLEKIGDDFNKFKFTIKNDFEEKYKDTSRNNQTNAEEQKQEGEDGLEELSQLAHDFPSLNFAFGEEAEPLTSLTKQLEESAPSSQPEQSPTLAEQGDVITQVELTQMYKKGQGIKQNDVEKVKETTQNNLEGGYGDTPHNKQASAEEQASEREGGVEESNQSTHDSSALDILESGVMELSTSLTKNSEEFTPLSQLEQLQTLAEEGNALAQFNLAQMYKRGEGVKQSDVKAAEWYLRAAKQGEVRAQFNLALMYDEGQGVEQSAVKAAEWYLKAAEQGDSDSQFNLALMYGRGEGVEQSDAKAIEWYLKAAEQGNTKAQFNLAQMYRRGEGVEQNGVKAVEWYLRAAEQGDTKAQFNLALMYRRGEGVEQNDVKAAEWYIKAAKQGNVSAQFNLALMYENGQGVEQSHTKAAEWYLKAAEQGHALATLEMSSRYFNGKGVPDNYMKAYTFLLLYKGSKSDDQNDTAEQNLQRSLAKLLTPEQIAVAQKDAAMLWEKINKPEE